MNKAVITFKADTGDMKVTAEFCPIEQTYICKAYLRRDGETSFNLLAIRKMAEFGWTTKHAAERMKKWCGY